MVIDMTGEAANREIVFDRLGQVLSPTWSPDGSAIAFSALAGGFTDLYVCDVATGKLRQLTDDAFADLQPAWSHDGRTIAFVTERFSSDLGRAAVRTAAAGDDGRCDRHVRGRVSVDRQRATQPAMVARRSRSVLRRAMPTAR